MPTMRGYMFKNRWGALLFVCLIAFGAASLIGDEDDEGLLLSAAGELTKTQADFANRSTELSRPDERPVLNAGDIGQFSSDEELASEFVPDDELIDDTRGFEPEPDINPSYEMERAEEGDVFMVIDND